MKKIIGIFCFILLGLCLVSCMEEPPIDKPDQGNTEPPSGGKLPDDGKDDTPSVDKQPDDEKDDWEKKIVFWHTMGDSLQKVLQDAIDSFEKANEGWEIESVQFGSMDHILEETISNSNKPDLVYAFPEQVARYKEKGLIVDMNHYIEDENVGFSKDEVDDFIKAFYEEGKSYGDGAMYSLPFSKASEVLYYYKKEASDYPKTWEELEAIEDLNHITLRVESEVLLFTTLAHQSGANYTTLEDN
ncbi:MAG: extracellular solute-binding protein, partial [Anaeroplasmataceae bacterium]|nr:extracellular solute-binding protein [Anaeroplasmataceae bacterium]